MEPAPAELSLSRRFPFLKHGSREEYETSRQGLKFGTPDQAIPHAISQMHAMERSVKAHRSGSASGIANFAAAASQTASATGVWFPIGPQPMLEAANFTGAAIGSQVRDDWAG